MDDDYLQKFVNLPALFNNENLLEFAIEPDKRSLILGKTFLKLYVEIESEYVPDNNFGNKLFEFLDLNINYEDVSYKCSINDYDYTSHIKNKLFRNPGYLRHIKFEGHFDSVSLDSSELKQEKTLVENRRGEKFTKSEEIDGKTVDKVFYRYVLVLPINHGLCDDNLPLPPGVHVRLTFHRAKANKGMKRYILLTFVF
jgi:hypothetical protein